MVWENKLSENIRDSRTSCLLLSSITFGIFHCTTIFITFSVKIHNFFLNFFLLFLNEFQREAKNYETIISERKKLENSHELFFVLFGKQASNQNKQKKQWELINIYQLFCLTNELLFVFKNTAQMSLIDWEYFSFWNDFWNIDLKKSQE